MPYLIKRGTGARPYKIVLKETGKVVGTSKSLAEAKSAIAARYANTSALDKKKS